MAWTRVSIDWFYVISHNYKIIGAKNLNLSLSNYTYINIYKIIIILIPNFIKFWLQKTHQ